MPTDKPVVTFIGVLTAFVSAFSYWGSAAFSPSLLLTVVTVPAAVVCCYFGARKSAVIAIYFSATAWIPHWASVGSTFDFGIGWFILFGAGLLLSLTLAIMHTVFTRHPIT